jgi:hypothetical protein
MASMNSDILNFDLCDLEMQVKSKTWILCMSDKNLAMIRPLVKELKQFFCFESDRIAPKIDRLGCTPRPIIPTANNTLPAHGPRGKHI